MAEDERVETKITLIIYPTKSSAKKMEEYKTHFSEQNSN